MPHDSSLPEAAPVAPERVQKPRRALRFAALGALVAGIVVSGAIVVSAQTAAHPEATAGVSTEAADESIELSIGAEELGDAESALNKAKTALSGAASSVDTDDLEAYVGELTDYEELPRDQVIGLTASASSEAQAVVTATAQLHEQKALEEQRKQEERKAAKEAERKAAEAITNAQSPAGARAAAQDIAANEFGWGSDQFGCLSNLWQKESGWNYQATNPSSGAYGIPQSLPGAKMSTVAGDWQTNPLTQIRWGLTYIQATYGAPCAAWGHSQSVNWY